MSIGLYDADFATYIHIPFNLELMKLSTYYKKKKEIVVMTENFEPERYSNYIIRKDYNDNNFDKRFFQPNVQYGGHAFSKEKYISLPEEIESCKPDKQLYFKFKNQFNTTSQYAKIFTQMVSGEHIRISLDGKTLWENSDKSYSITNNTRVLIFHDYDLNAITDGYEKVKEIIDKTNKNFINDCSIGMKFPVQLYNETDYEKWKTIFPSQYLFSMQYNGLMENEMFYDFIARAHKNMIKQLEYNITYGCKNEQEFFEKRLPYVFKQCLLAMNNNKAIKLTFNENFFVDKNWEKVITLLNYYINSREKYLTYIKKRNYKDYGDRYTLFHYVTKSPKLYFFKTFPFTKDEVRQLFGLVREKSYETFKMFYETARVELKGGKIIERNSH